MSQKLVEPATRLLLLWTFDERHWFIRTIVSATRTAVRAEIVNARLTSHSSRCWWAHVIDPGASTWAGL